MRRLLWVLLVWPSLAFALPEENPVLDLTSSEIRKTWFGGLTVDLMMSEAVPYAVGVADNPPRLVVRFQSVVDLIGQTEARPAATLIPAGLTTELQLPLERPRVLESAEIEWPQNGGAILRLRLNAAEADVFQSAAARWRAPIQSAPLERPPSNYKLSVMLDPGHGGQDPGAQHGGIREADIVLDLAETLKAKLEALGFEVGLTRENDDFVTLSDRIGRATTAGADLFLSLHADALRAGHASGASVHSLTEAAAASGDRFLLNRLGSGALSSTVGAVDDATMKVLMELAREQSLAASETLAAELVAAMSEAGIALYKTPQKHSNFVVLRAADMPSVLVELGYLSEADDRARLVDPEWRQQMATAIAQGIQAWADTGAD